MVNYNLLKGGKIVIRVGIRKAGIHVRMAYMPGMISGHAGTTFSKHYCLGFLGGHVGSRSIHTKGIRN